MADLTDITNSVSIFGKTKESIAGYTFDAVMEEVLDMSVEVPSYPIESGASVSDHRIVQPIRYKLTGITSNTPMKVSVADFAGGLVSNLVDNPIVAAASGLSAGYLSGWLNKKDGSATTAAQAALQKLVEILEGNEPFDVVAGDITLKNMVITRLSRTRNPENENALVAEIELQEFVSLDRLNDSGQPDHSYLRSGDPSQTGCAKDVTKGTTTLTDSSSAASSTVKTDYEAEYGATVWLS